VKLGEEGNVTNPVGGRVAKGGLSLETVVCLYLSLESVEKVVL
jgi:hypothetical protein